MSEKTEKPAKPEKAAKPEAAAKSEKAAAPAKAKAKGKGEGYAVEGEAKASAGKTRLQKHYEEVVIKQLMTAYGYKNPHEVPRLQKIVVNMGVGEATSDTRKVQSAAAEMAVITGQKPVITKARKSIATFKVREEMPLGCKVTLRKARMYEFLDRLINIALPRVRDFRGVNGKAFDGRGNYALGLKEQLVFPEVDYDKVDDIRGMDIVICTSAKTDQEAKALLKGFDMPFNS